MATLTPTAAAVAVGVVLSAAAASLVATPKREVPLENTCFQLPADTNIFTKGEARLARAAVDWMEVNRGRLESDANPLDVDFIEYQAARKALGGY